MHARFMNGRSALRPPCDGYHMGRNAARALPVAAAGDTGTVEPAPQTSMLWGKSGEAWRPSSHIVDHSWAGYMGQQRRIPAYQDRVFNVKKYGAKGDGVAGRPRLGRRGEHRLRRWEAWEPAPYPALPLHLIKCRSCCHADDTQAILDAVEAASAAAFEMGTVVCGPQSDRRCLVGGLLALITAQGEVKQEGKGARRACAACAPLTTALVPASSLTPRTPPCCSPRTAGS